MRRIVILVASIIVLLALIGCTVNRPICATSNPLGEKVGVYSQTALFGFPPPMNNKAATAAAALNGNITKISTVDYNTTWMLIMMKYTTIVTGE